jgi:hypothetical protein
MFYILKRKGLGRSSIKAFIQYCLSPIQVIKNTNIPQLDPSDTILRWGCTSTIPQGHILNKADSIQFVNNKAEFRFKFQERFPHLVPNTWYSSEDPGITFPCIVRPQHHAQGKRLYFCNNYEDLRHVFIRFPNLSITGYISEYIPKVKEYRVCFIQGLVAWVAEKLPKDPSNIAWNVAQGGKFINCNWKNWPIKTIDACYLAYQESGLYLAGIDVMLDDKGKPYILEVNSAPSHTSPYRQECTAKCLNYTITVSTKTIPLDLKYKKYLKYIHPAIKKNNNDTNECLA